MMNLGCFCDGKRIDPWFQKLKRLDKFINARSGPFVPVILHINVEGLCANKICVISQLATRHKAFVNLLQETHCTNAGQIVILHFTLAGWVSSRKYGLAMFFHKELSWTLVDRSAIEWLWILIAAGLSTSTNHQPCNSHSQLFHCCHTPIFLQVILTASTLTGTIVAPIQMENAW